MGTSDRRCPTFKAECEKLDRRIPENKYKYFPVITDPSTWEADHNPPPRPDSSGPAHPPPPQSHHPGFMRASDLYHRRGPMGAPPRAPTSTNQRGQGSG